MGLDEDGVTFGTMAVGALDATVTVNVQGGSALLDAWIDFNGDGTWGGPGEQIFDSAVVGPVNPLAFDVPSWAEPGTTFARFRLSTQGGLGVGGSATDGEVEDYQVTILPPAEASEAFGAHTITTEINDPQSVYAADVDGDGDMDVLSASMADDKIAWYENDPTLGFTTHTISTDADGAWSVFAADVDGDGDMDVLSASRYDDKIAWYENDGSQAFTQRTVANTAFSAESVFAADIDGDGDTDVVGASGVDKVAWYENDGSEAFTQHTITSNATGAQDVFAADVDGDGDMDILGAFANGEEIVWYENDGSGAFTQNTITNNAGGAESVFAADIDGDGDMDVLSASSAHYTQSKIVWYENFDSGYDFTAETFSADEGDSTNTTMVVMVERSGRTDIATSVDVTPTDGTATAGQDYSPATVTIVFEPGETTQPAPLVLLGETEPEYDETVLLSLANFSDGSGPGTVQPTAVLTIVDDDPLVEGDYGDAPLPYPTTFLEGGALHDVVGPTLGATLLEYDETVLLSLGGFSNGTGLGTGQPTAVLTIVNDDPVVDVDYGDAPLPYPTTFAELGPFHNAVGLTLGASRDVESDGAHSTAADADGADEDGVAFGTIAVGALDNSLTVHVQGGSGLLDAWIDFNHDGSWGGPGEQIFDTMAVASGDNELLFDVPSWAMPGETTARFRLSTQGHLGIRGATTDGEVEDYKVTILPPDDATEIFQEHAIATQAIDAMSVFAADVDSDGDMDVLGASYDDDTIAWFENDGSQGFTEHNITTDADEATSVFAADVDNDGDIDVLSASNRDDTIAWYENDGSEGFTPHTIATSANGARSVFAADVDGDGDMDVLSASFNDDKIAWYENDGSGGFTPHTISTNANGARTVFAADVDGDGDMDVLSASYVDNTIAWYENTLVHLLGDMDLDGDVDLDDVDDFVQGLVEPEEYEATYGVSPTVNGDTDQDGDLDLDDVDDFVAILTGGGGGGGGHGSGEQTPAADRSADPPSDLSAGWFRFTSSRQSTPGLPLIHDPLLAAPDDLLAGADALRWPTADDTASTQRVVPRWRSVREPIRPSAHHTPDAPAHDAALAAHVDWLAKYRV